MLVFPLEIVALIFAGRGGLSIAQYRRQVPNCRRERLLEQTCAEL